PVAAVAMGSEIIEKHITLDRDLKGTDQRGSLGPEGIHRMVRDIRLLEMSKGVHDIFQSPGTESSKKKLARSIAVKRKLEQGETISESDIWMLSPGDGFRWAEKDEVLGKKLSRQVSANEIIYPEMLSE
ncbi:MAG: shikimate dehydrogenase, partial [Flavobacteriales bacterium]|nr:shikimate dehydrogenase [Flavobacteriales bacterium]